MRVGTGEAGMRAEFISKAPTEVLRPYVRRYIGYRQQGVTLPVHRGLPSSVVTLIISLADPIRMVGGPGAEHGPVSLRSVVGGLHLTPALIQQDSYQCGLQLELNPLGVHILLGVSAPELAMTVCDLNDLPTRLSPYLVERLVEAADWDSRFQLLDQALSACLRPVTLLSEIQWAWRRMATAHGATRIGPLADEIGWSRRHFTQRFTEQVGVPPKQATRLLRFERSAAVLRSGRCRSLAELAVECGFYDQAHLTNEWRQFAGCTPGTWIREELPFLQSDQHACPSDLPV